MGKIGGDPRPHGFSEVAITDRGYRGLKDDVRFVFYPLADMAAVLMAILLLFRRFFGCVRVLNSA